MDSLGRTLDNTHIGDTLITGDLDVEGSFVVSAIDIEDDLKINGDLTVVGTSYLSTTEVGGVNPLTLTATSVDSKGNLTLNAGASVIISTNSLGTLINFDVKSGATNTKGIGSCGSGLEVQIGTGADATGLANVAIGNNATATGSQGSTALGYNSNSTANYTTALGNEAEALFTGSTALGYNATTTATNQVVIGGSTATEVCLGTSTGNADLKCADITASSVTTTEQTPVAYSMTVQGDSGTATDVSSSMTVSYIGKWVFLNGEIEFKVGTLSGAIYFSVPRTAAADADGSLGYKENIWFGITGLVPRIRSGENSWQLYTNTQTTPAVPGSVDNSSNLVKLHISLMYIGNPPS